MPLPFQKMHAKWISDQAMIDQTPRVIAYRLRFESAADETIRLHVSADEKYELFVDGKRIGRGPERGDRLNWFYESYGLKLSAGEHTIVARVWWLGDNGPSPFAQMTVRHAFLLCSDDADPSRFATGHAMWMCKRLPGYEWLPPGQAWGCGAKVRIVGSEFDWDAETGGGSGWVAAVVAGDAASLEDNDRPLDWRLRPALLPPMKEERTFTGISRLVSDAREFPFHDDPYKPQPPVRSADHLPEEARQWNPLLRGQHSPLTIPPHTARRVLIDLGDYYCAYPDLTVAGGRGALLRLSWAESLYERLPIAEKHEWIGNMPKGDRDEIEGKFFHGVTDEFLPAGGADKRTFTTLWWEAGRYVQLLIRTADDPLIVHSLHWRVTHYPFSFDAPFDCSDSRLAKVNRLALRSLTMGSHEHFTDSPYYEQIQYVGDTRLESLTTYATTSDNRLARKAIELLDQSRLPDGMIQSRYPSRVTQYILGFDLWWVGMVHDWMMWRGDRPFVAARLPGVRAAIEAALSYLTPDSVVRMPRRPNFTFMDWSSGWEGGHPVTSSEITGLVTWQLVHVLGLAAEIEDYAGEPELSARWRRRASEVADAATVCFWDDVHGLMSDDPAKTHFSEHTQILALLSGQLPPDKQSTVIDGLFSDPNLSRTTIYFSHYLFEVCHRLLRHEAMFDRLKVWFDLLNKGLRTLPEMPEPTRSDCHAWGAHVVYHCFASVLGVRPASPGFLTVHVSPMLGPLEWAKGALPHPAGRIELDLRQTRPGCVEGTIQLPAGITGTLNLDGKRTELLPGLNRIQAVTGE